MLVAAALVPDTALLLAGAAGRADPLADVREDALRVVGALLDTDPAEVVVVVPARRAPGPRGRRRRSDDATGPWRPTLAAAGIPDRQVGLDRQTGLGRAGEVLDDVPAAVVVTLAGRGGWTGPVRVVPAEAPAGTPARAVDDALVAIGRRLAGGPERTALLLVGSLSARRGPLAPLPAHPRAPEADEVLLDSFEHPAQGEAPALSSVEADEVAASVGRPALVLAGAAPEGTRLVRRTVTAPLGVGLPVVLWATGAAP